MAAQDAYDVIVYECKGTHDLFRLSEVKQLKQDSGILSPYKVGGFQDPVSPKKHSMRWILPIPLKTYILRNCFEVNVRY